jgi:hypothetical protein
VGSESVVSFKSRRWRLGGGAFSFPAACAADLPYVCNGRLVVFILRKVGDSGLELGSASIVFVERVGADRMATIEAC